MLDFPPKSAEGQVLESRDEIIAFSLPTMTLNTSFAKFVHMWGTTFRLTGWHFLPNTCPFFESIRYSLDIAGFVELHDSEAVAFFAMLVVDDGIVPIIIKCHSSNRHQATAPDFEACPIGTSELARYVCVVIIGALTVLLCVVFPSWTYVLADSIDDLRMKQRKHQ